jgi:hypothetical protein
LEYDRIGPIDLRTNRLVLIVEMLAKYSMLASAASAVGTRLTSFPIIVVAKVLSDNPDSEPRPAHAPYLAQRERSQGETRGSPFDLIDGGDVAKRVGLSLA